jgi:hypothetical protein
MDPQATLLRIFAAIDEDDTQEALDGINDLTKWVHQGGFVPTLDKDMTMTVMELLHDHLGNILIAEKGLMVG